MPLLSREVLAGVVPFVVGALLIWRVRAKYRHATGRQRLSRYRGPVRILIFGALLALIAGSLPCGDAGRLGLLLACVGGGVALGRWGLRRTRFEAVKGEGLFYTPEARIEMPIVALFVARIAYRLHEVYIADPSVPRSLGEFSGNAFTLMACGLSAGYYVTHAAGLMRWRRRVLRAAK
jgi:hypothetical protein